MTRALPVRPEERSIRRVAVVDDEELSRDATAVVLEDAGYTPVVIDLAGGQYRTVAALVQAVTELADAAVVDHRLQHGAAVPYFGAEAVAALCYTARRPAVLTTQYLDQDFDVSIREHRAHIPVVLPYDAVAAHRMQAAFADVRAELDGVVPPSRRPRRVQVQVKDAKDEDGRKVYDVLVPSWNARRTVRFPAALVDATVSGVSIGDWLEADVNIGAATPGELFFADFVRSPEPDPDDGLD